VGPHTPGTPNKNNKAPTPVSLEKSNTKRKILATAASTRSKRNKGIIKYFNQDALVPASDVESSSSPYSRSASPFLPSDGSTDTENSGDEGKVTKNLGKEMSDQPHVSNNTDKHGNKNQPLK
jgi:hypothetical protein